MDHSIFPISICENYIKAVEFRYPKWIPCSLGFAPLVWKIHRRSLEEIVLAHPRLFPEYEEGKQDFYDEMPPVYRQGEHFRDNWGCVWYNIQEGLEGIVVEHPLADWKNLATYHMPDPLVYRERGEERKDWDKIKRDLEDRKSRSWVRGGDGERLFDRLYFLRGFENLMLDFGEESPELPQLIAMLEDYEMALVKKWLEIGVDTIGFHTDIGTQRGLMISPASFRKYVKPMFMHLFQTCRQAGVHVNLSSDGNLLKIVDDLVECGVSTHDPQLRANTLQGIVRAYKGKLFVHLDLDRQSFPFSTPQQLRQQVKEVVDAMAMPEGGLGLLAQFYDGAISLRNIEAICEAMEDYCF